MRARFQVGLPGPFVLQSGDHQRAPRRNWFVTAMMATLRLCWWLLVGPVYLAVWAVRLARRATPARPISWAAPNPADRVG